MNNFWRKIKNSWLNSFLFSCFLLAIFLILFYLSNLDLKNGKNYSSVSSVSFEDSDSEIKKRMGQTSIASLNFEGWAKYFNLPEGKDRYDGDSDKDGLLNYQEYVYGTNPLEADSDGDGYSDKQETINGFDPDAGGTIKPIVEIEIPKTKVIAPMIWSKSQNEDKLMADLENGIIHYPKTASPGQNGNMVISGHSSNYIWAKGNFNHIFKDLNNLEKGDIVTVKTIQENGRIIVYSYRVTDKFITWADDERIFASTQNPTLTLSTCWPLGTNFKRLIVKAEILQ